MILSVLLIATSVKAQHLSGSWIGILDAGPTGLHLVFNIEKDENGREICLMDSPDQAAKGIPTTIAYISPDSLNLDIPAIRARYYGKLSEDGILHGVFEQMGRKFKLDLNQGRMEYNRPQEPVAPYPYSTEEVTFINSKANVTLAGTLTFPSNYQKGKKVPVVLLVTGSGAQNRDEELFGHKPFLVIADFLARNGTATLRYDDRAVGKSTGETPTRNTREVAEDAAAGIRFLRSRIEFSKVGLLGHSEGGSVAFMLGADRLLDFAISMAGCGVKGDESLYAQAKRITELSGQPYPLTKDQYVQMALSKPNPWLEFFFNYDPIEDIRNTRCPVFALNGDKDCQVVASVNLTSIEENLPQNRSSKVKLYPGLNHLFQECISGLPQEYSSIEQTISPVVLEELAEWIIKYFSHN